MIKLFVFDLGNVIVPFEHRQIVVKLLKKVREKIVPSPRDCFSFMFDLEEGYINPYEEGLISSIEFFSTIRDRFGLDMSFEEFKQIWNPIFNGDPEVNEIIYDLKRRGYPIFLLSNTNELHFSYIIENFPIIHLLDEWILSFEVGAKKPKKLIYEKVLEKMDVLPGEVFYVDDIEQYVDAAKSCGFQGTVFRDAARLRESIRRTGLELDRRE